MNSSRGVLQQSHPGDTEALKGACRIVVRQAIEYIKKKMQHLENSQLTVCITDIMRGSKLKKYC